ncbi:MAG: integrase [Anaerolineales bacterium]
MSLEDRNQHLKNEQRIYRSSNKRGKGEQLTHLEQVTGLGRKTLIVKLNGDLVPHPRRKQRGRSYGPEVEDALRVIAEAYDYISAERMTPHLVEMAETLARHGELRVTPALLEQLGRISVATVGRILRRLHQDDYRLPRPGPQEANRARQAVPAERIPWDMREPGHFEADLVHHGGSSTKGDYVHTIQLIDVATGWSERVAVLGRSYLVMQNGFQRIQERLPFPVLEIHPDNGSEFFNQHMLTFWPTCFPGVRLSRSRPWQKNDNRFVEQKNDTLVRQYLGDQRFDTVAQTQALNALYDQMWWYYNFFQPVMRLQEKTVTTDEQGHKHIRRRFDQAQTPFERLCASGLLSTEQQQAWRAYRDAINPRQLRRTIYQQLEALRCLPGNPPGVTVDVRDALIDLEEKGEGQPSLIII